jgi:hypothetical protein
MSSSGETAAKLAVSARPYREINGGWSGIQFSGKDSRGKSHDDGSDPGLRERSKNVEVEMAKGKKMMGESASETGQRPEVRGQVDLSTSVRVRGPPGTHYIADIVACNRPLVLIKSQRGQ